MGRDTSLRERCEWTGRQCSVDRGAHPARTLRRWRLYPGPRILPTRPAPQPALSSQAGEDEAGPQGRCGPVTGLRLRLGLRFPGPPDLHVEVGAALAGQDRDGIGV